MRQLIITLFVLNPFLNYSQNCDLICKDSFETPVVTSNPGLYPATATNCWQTTAPDGIIELWSNGFYRVNAYHGNQFLELNANYVSTVFQNFYALPGTDLEISFAHRGRAGIDVMDVTFGPVGGSFSLIGTYSDSTVGVIIPL